jgi:hypothetical protein
LGARDLALRRIQRIGWLGVRAKHVGSNRQAKDASSHDWVRARPTCAVLALLSDNLPKFGCLTLEARQFPENAMRSRRDTSPSRAKRGDQPTSSVPARSDIGENSASELIEAPRKPGFNPLDPHDFADGGGSGGGEAFSRSRRKARRK